MSFESELKGHLQGGASVVALVVDRITPVKLADGSAMPAVVYSIIFGNTENSLDGFTSNIVRYRVQIDCWGNLFREVVELALAVRDRMNAPPAAFTCTILSFPGFDTFEEETKKYRRTLEFSCEHREA